MSENQKQKVAIVSQNMKLIDGIKWKLSKITSKVEIYSNLNSLKEDISSHKFDVVIVDSDWSMQAQISVLNAIKVENPEARFILLVKKDEMSSGVSAQRLGEVDFIHSEDDLNTLSHRIMSLCKQELLDFEHVGDIEEMIHSARELIINSEFVSAAKILRMALSRSPSRPESYNLLGVIEEKVIDRFHAQNYYRAALAMDGAYKPAWNNLNRTTTFGGGTGEPDLG